MRDFKGSDEDLVYVRSPAAIRAQAARIAQIEAGGGTQFRVDAGRLDVVADAVARVTLENYPQLNIPFHSRWSHFQAGGVDRLAQLTERLSGLDPLERARTRIDLVIVSVLLDAGAGDAWAYHDSGGRKVARSEGLAVASFEMFLAGAFSSDPSQPLRVDATALEMLTETTLARGFQVSAQNPLVGLEGRLGLLRSLGKALRKQADYFGKEARPGGLVDHLKATLPTGDLPAARILDLLQKSLGEIWPGRVSLNGVNLGDVWTYAPLGDGLRSLVPFHKLSQWLTYSVVDPFQDAGFRVGGFAELTTLAEYRNGGLLVDYGLLNLREAALYDEAHKPASELVVEWRALTVHWMEEVARRTRKLLGKTEDELPLGKILEGGTWWAGRRVAAQKRPGGGPPIRLVSDGTVF
jgi:hypothetical protein